MKFLDTEALKIEFARALEDTFRDPEAKEPAVFNRGWITYLAATIQIVAKSIADRTVQLHDEQAATIRGLVSRLDAADKELADMRADALASLERRASRHAEHLARLEDRTRKLEGK